MLTLLLTLLITGFIVYWLIRHPIKSIKFIADKYNRSGTRHIDRAWCDQEDALMESGYYDELH